MSPLTLTDKERLESLRIISEFRLIQVPVPTSLEEATKLRLNGKITDKQFQYWYNKFNEDTATVHNESTRSE